MPDEAGDFWYRSLEPRWGWSGSCYRLPVSASCTYTDQQGRFGMLTPAGLEVQIFVDPKDAKNVPAELQGKVREEVQSKGNML